MEKGKKTMDELNETVPEVEKRPVYTATSRENEIIAMAYDRVEQRIREDRATGPELVHFLKMGSAKGRLEKEILEKEKELISAKTEALNTQRRMDELYSKAIDALKSYKSGDDCE